MNQIILKEYLIDKILNQNKYYIIKIYIINNENNISIENECANIYRSLKNTINVLLKLKESKLNHLDIKPCNILVNYND